MLQRNLLDFSPFAEINKANSSLTGWGGSVGHEGILERDDRVVGYVAVSIS